MATVVEMQRSNLTSMLYTMQYQIPLLNGKYYGTEKVKYRIVLRFKISIKDVYLQTLRHFAIY